MTPRPAVVADARLAAHLDAIATGLCGPRRQRARILAELGDGLDQAVSAHLAAGLPYEDAVTTAIDRFGAAGTVAHAFTGELATASARRTLGWLLATGPLVGVWWLLLLHAYPWRTGPVALVAVLPVVPLVVVGIATAAATFATTGRLMRWLPEASPRQALAAAVAVAVGAVGGDALTVGLFLGSDRRAQALAVVAVAASLARSGGALVSARHAARLRRRLASRTAS